MNWAARCFYCLVTLTLAVGCTPEEDCNRNPGHDDCFDEVDVGPDNVPLDDAGPPAESYLSYQNIEWDEYLCGGFLQRILWTFPGGAPADGWIIQRVTVTSAAFNLAQDEDDLARFMCVGGSELKDEWWEAWKVGDGQDRVTYKRGIDRWFISPVNVDGTSFTQRGYAVFVEGGLPAGFVANSVQGAGSLPARDTKPPWWDAVPAAEQLDRRITSTVDCCPPGANNFVNTHEDQ